MSTAHTTLEIAKISDGVTGDFEETVSTSKADTGNIFCYDPDADQYIYNLSTKGFTRGTYLLQITLDDGQRFIVQFLLK